MKIVNVMRSEYERRAVPPPLNSYIISGKRDSCQQVCVKIIIINLNLSYMYYESNHVPLLLSVTSLRKKVYLFDYIKYGLNPATLNHCRVRSAIGAGLRFLLKVM